MQVCQLPALDKIIVRTDWWNVAVGKVSVAIECTIAVADVASGLKESVTKCDRM